MGRNKYVYCKVCTKNVRSDKPHNHRENKYRMKSCLVCHKTMIAGHLSRHMKTHAKRTQNILDNIKKDQEEFNQKQETGQVVEKLLKINSIDPRSLRSEYSKALEIINVPGEITGTLKPWQQKLLGDITPSDRNIIWVVGRKGAEGKSWFQKYLVQLLGSQRIFQTTIEKRSDGILHALSKRLISLIDIFIFNIPRSFSMDQVPYNLLEQLKDGQAISSKYNSKCLRFKTPNTVLVFANYEPYRVSMSFDRWQIFDIDNFKIPTRNLHVNNTK